MHVIEGSLVEENDGRMVRVASRARNAAYACPDGDAVRAAAGAGVTDVSLLVMEVRVEQSFGGLMLCA